jgi:hypothetical protein
MEFQTKLILGEFKVCGAEIPKFIENGLNSKCYRKVAAFRIIQTELLKLEDKQRADAIVKVLAWMEATSDQSIFIELYPIFHNLPSRTNLLQSMLCISSTFSEIVLNCLFICPIDKYFKGIVRMIGKFASTPLDTTQSEQSTIFNEAEEKPFTETNQLGVIISKLTAITVENLKLILSNLNIWKSKCPQCKTILS